MVYKKADFDQPHTFYAPKNEGFMLGVNDFDGTIVEEKITHAAGAETEQFIKKKDLIKIIMEMGREPVERDTLYHVIQKY